MFKSQFIVLTSLCTLALWGCGQKGNLYLPTAPEAAYRATLPQTVLPSLAKQRPVPTASQVLPAIATPSSDAPPLTGQVQLTNPNE